jgi:hypothetical protein
VFNALVALSGALVLARKGLVLSAASPLRLLLATLLAGFLLLGPWIALRPRNRRARGLTLAGCLALALCLALGGPEVLPGTDFLQGGVGCFTTELLLSLLPLATGVWVLTTAAFQPARVAILALSGGAAGLFALHVHCPNGLWSHLLVFHLLPWLAITGVALVVRWRLPSRSFAP